MSVGGWRADSPAPPLRLLAINSNGLRDARKRRELLEAFGSGPWDVMVVLEAHTSSFDEVQGWAREGTGRGSPFRGQCFACPHTTTSAGVAAFFKATAPVDGPTPVAAPEGGRLLDVSFSYAGLPISLVGCYAPTEAALRPGFFTGDLSRLLPTGRLTLMCGDWNHVSDPLDVVGAAASPHRYAGAAEFEGLCVQHRLVDAWRHLHPGHRAATHVASAAGAGAARLDRWYVSAPLLGGVTRAGILQGFPGDHLAIDLTLSPPAATITSGPGRFRLPLHFLSDVDFIAATAECIAAYLQAHPAEPGLARQRWVGLKAACTLHCMTQVAQRREEAAAARRSLLTAAAAAHRAYCAHPHAPGALSAYQQAAAALREHSAAAEARRAAQQEVLWHCFGERPTRWFHLLGHEVSPNRPLTAVLDPADPDAPPADMCTHAGRHLAAQRAVAHFSADSPVGLFRREPTDAEAAARLLSAIDSTLTPTEAAATLGPNDEGYIEAGEVEALFPSLPRGSSPGLDGLPYEFYITFWDLLGQPFESMAAEALEAASDAGVAEQEGGVLPFLPPEVTVGLIVLLAKPGAADPRLLSSHRPITLLNCDYRLLARVLVARFASPLLSVIDPTQTAFLPGRWIGDNVLLHLEEVSYLREADAPGCIVFLDFEKAYDRVDRPWLFSVMRALHFPQRAVLWAQLMLSGCTAMVSLNGFYSPSFPLARSVQQGSPLSVLLYVIAAQPLAAALRRAAEQGVCRPLLLPGGSPAPICHQHADDTTIHVLTPRDAAAALTGPVSDFCGASNARLHLGKCKGLLFGEQVSIDPATRVCGECGVRFPPHPASWHSLGCRSCCGC